MRPVTPIDRDKSFIATNIEPTKLQERPKLVSKKESSIRWNPSLYHIEN